MCISARVVSLAACAVLVPLFGCQDHGPDAAFEDYLARLGRTLAVEPAAVHPVPPPRLPRPGQLRLAIPPGSLDALDFLALSGCAVQVTIGKRNSSLGRLAAQSQRLLLELEYLRLAPECIAHQRRKGETALALTLEQAWSTKRRQLPALIFNATLAGHEYRAFWHTPAASKNYPGATNSAVISALQAINSHTRRWLTGDYRADNRDFEILLSEVAAGDGGALLQALVHQGVWLSTADTMLEQRMARGPLCTPGIRPAAAHILPGVIRKSFIGGIQPRAAALGRRYYELLPAIIELETLLESALPPGYRGWKSLRDEQIAEFVQAPRQHVAVLKAVQQPCIHQAAPTAK